ncbi:MAG TPA: DUF3592 domain-containing protein [Candidatus Nanopelagicales bacterium]
MTTVLLGFTASVAAVVLVAVVWSLVKALREESANASLRREGVRAVGTVVDNTMTSTPQRRLVFSPVVEFRARSGESITAPAQQAAASSWPRGSNVEVAHDPAEPSRFVLADPSQRGHLVANALLGLIVVSILLGSVVAMYHVWWEFRYDRSLPETVGTEQPLQP